MAALNDLQKRSIYHAFVDMDRQIADMEAEISAAEHASPFARVINDLTPTELRVLREYFERIRSAMVGCLAKIEYPINAQTRALRWTLLTRLMFVKLPLEEVGPKQLQGYGSVSDAGREQVLAVQDEIARLLDRATAFIRRGLGRDLAERLGRLGAGDDARTLQTIERVVTEHNLVEFRPQLESLVRRYEHPRYEVAVFGRVSSGKSSLLNHLCGADVLPVGVTPITAVPTRVERGESAECIVTIAESGPRRIDVAQLREFASEERNPGNHRHVTDLLVRLPSPKLRDGVVLVDTPGIGSLARSGAAETWAYLPRCDLGIVLIDAHSAPSHDDVDLIHRLVDAGIPVHVLVSKSDLVGPAERAKLVEYIQAQLRSELGTELPVHAVSVLGDEASLLDTWFDQELTPLLDRSRELAAQSLRLKIADLRDSVIAVLESLRGNSRHSAGARSASVAAELLDSADAAVRTARSSAWYWTDRDGVLVDVAIDEAARAVVGGSPVANPVSAALQSVLADRSQSALRTVRSLQRKLGNALDQIRNTPLETGLDPSAVTDLVISGLPDVDLSQFQSNGEAPRAWWGRLAPSLAERTASRSIRKRFGSMISQQVTQYERQLRLWLGQAIEQLVDAYESQAGIVREQLRRSSGDGASSPTDNEPSIDAALQELRSTTGAAPDRAERNQTPDTATARG